MVTCLFGQCTFLRMFGELDTNKAARLDGNPQIVLKTSDPSLAPVLCKLS